ncbi:hypothetical protein [Dyella flagellata]|uniref:Membrane domain of glycerophosphoryl diester phosphodiesterase n=1 Tax=Dyella flagellata TaxID=1867833 RepID=A0ABQ5XEY4_9GAMM|nr:hypothetical protein [Dyella flagellata]GLQ90245.1 hypothetical protein GCM10007898_38200 [Dyella flagellata]
MAIRSRGPSAGFGWLGRGISVGFRHPKPLFGGAFFLLLGILLPTLITLPLQIHAMQAGTPMHPGAFVGLMGLSALLGLLVLPLYAGYLQIIDAVEQGRVARAGDIIKPYVQGKALRLIGYGVVLWVVYLVMFGSVFVATGGGVAHWYMEALSAQANHLPPPTALPDGFGMTLSLCGVLGIFMLGFYPISLGQVALGNRSVFGAIGDGLVGSLKNLLPLLMLVLGFVLAGICFAICFGILAFLLAIIAKLIGAWLMIVLIIPLYFALVLTLSTVMFGVMYHLWRDVCGDDTATGTAEPLAA